jgi:dGTP triphosphohydrolase
VNQHPGATNLEEKTMKTVKVSKEQLMNVLKVNRKRHAEQFDVAFDGYKKKFIVKTEKILSDAKAGVIPSRRALTTLDKPEDHVDDYDNVLRMLVMHVEDSIELSYNEFRCYVNDEWGWRNDFVRSFSANTE